MKPQIYDRQNQFNQHCNQTDLVSPVRLDTFSAGNIHGTEQAQAQRGCLASWFSQTARAVSGCVQSRTTTADVAA